MPQWIVVYDDETNYSDQQISYRDIDRNRAIRFHLAVHNVVVVVHLDPSRRLIYRKRSAIQMLHNGAEETISIYIVGWQQTVNGKNIQCLNFVFPDGHIEMLDRFREGHPWFYPIEFTPFEKDGG